jgi:predicted DNA-binding transcriptional regulator AlpA
VKTEFWLFGKFETPLIDVRQVADLLRVKPKTVQNMVASGKFPRPRQPGLWHIEEVGDYLDRAKDVPDATKAA